MSTTFFNALTNTPEISSSGQSSPLCMTPWSQSHDYESTESTDISDRRIFLSYEFGNEQFNVLAEDDSTPAGAWPEYLVALLSEWLLHRPRSLRAKRLFHGDLVLQEHHDGLISYVSDSSVTVRYGSGDGEFEADYPRSQFDDAVQLNRGDEIEAVIGLLRVPRSPVLLGSLYTDDEQRALDSDWKQRKGVVGDLKI